MKILVTGADGFAASRILSYYRTRHEMLGKNHRQMDVTDSESVRREFDAFRPQVVFHAGAVSDTGACARDPGAAWHINVEGSEIIARACREYGARLIYFSSDQVYFRSGVQGPHKETEHVSPPHPYGQQKLEAEKRCAKYNPDTVSLRLSWMYDRNIQKETEHGNLLTSILNAVKLEKTVSYPIYDYRCVTNIWDVIERLEAAAFLPAGVYNFASPHDGTTYDAARRILEHMGRTDLLLPDREAFCSQPRDLRMNMEKLRKHGIAFPQFGACLDKYLQLDGEERE